MCWIKRKKKEYENGKFDYVLLVYDALCDDVFAIVCRECARDEICRDGRITYNYICRLRNNGDNNNL